MEMSVAVESVTTQLSTSAMVKDGILCILRIVSIRIAAIARSLTAQFAEWTEGSTQTNASQIVMRQKLHAIASAPVSLFALVQKLSSRSVGLAVLTIRMSV